MFGAGSRGLYGLISAGDLVLQGLNVLPWAQGAWHARKEGGRGQQNKGKEVAAKLGAEEAGCGPFEPSQLTVMRSKRSAEFLHSLPHSEQSHSFRTAIQACAAAHWHRSPLLLRNPANRKRPASKMLTLISSSRLDLNSR